MSGGGGQRATERIASTLQSIQILSVLYLISEGATGGAATGDILSSTYLDGVPIKNPDTGELNYEDVAIDFRYGDRVQTPMEQFSSPTQRLSINRKVSVAGGSVVVRVNGSAQDIILTLATPRLLEIDTNDGDELPTDLEFLIETSVNGGAYVAEPTTASVGYRATATAFTGDTSLQIEPLARSLPAGTVLPFVFPREVTLSKPAVLGTTRIDVLPIASTIFANEGGTLTLTDQNRISGVAKENYFFERRIDFVNLASSSEFVDIRVTRITPDSTSEFLSNDLFLTSATVFQGVQQTYPHLALLGVQVSGGQFDSLPNISVLWDGYTVEVPANYNPDTREYVGLWDGTWKTMPRTLVENPAFVFRHALIDEIWGAGKRINRAAIDDAAIYSLGQYCDEFVTDQFGNSEPRFRISAYITQGRNAYDLLRDLASVFRGMIYYANGGITVAGDRPRQTTKVVGAADCIVEYDESGVLTTAPFNYPGTALETVASVFVVRYSNPDDQYREDFITYEDRELIRLYGSITEQRTAFGCPSRGQAQRVAQWRALAQRRSRTVSFQVGASGLFFAPGEVVAINDPLINGEQFSGRIRAASATSITIDRPLLLTGGAQYWILLKTAQGGLQRIPLQNASYAGDFPVLGLAQVLADVPPEGSTWLVEGTTEEIQPLLYSITAVVENEASGSYSVSGVRYIPEHYDLVDSATPQPRNPTLDYSSSGELNPTFRPSVLGGNAVLTTLPEGNP